MEELINELITKFNKTIPDNEAELSNYFKDELLTHLERIKKKNIDDENIRWIISHIAQVIINYDLEMKKRKLIPDENLEKIREISRTAYFMASDLLHGNEIDKSINTEEKIKELLDLSNKVFDFNKQEAKMLVSEGILDYEYVENPNFEKGVSLRLGRKIREMKREEKSNEKKYMEGMFMQNTGEKYLPIGSVVLLKETKKRLMITGFCITRNDLDEEKKWDYCGCLYPEGVIESSQVALFNHDQIETVYFYGLIDDEEREFKEKLNGYLESNNQQN